MEYSLPAWIGALVGTVVAVALYLPGVRVLERRLRAQGATPAAKDRAAFEDRLSIIRRCILGVDIAILASLGYWIGKLLAQPGAPVPLH